MLLTLNLLTTTIVVPPSNARKWQMGFNSAFKGLKVTGRKFVDNILFSVRIGQKYY
jgi:predicted amidophosphoribosyltransferase